MFEVAMKKVELFLDSGAFSAWSQKKEINIQEYIAFIKENQDVIDIYANLDVISDARGTWQNQMIMEEAGLQPLPVFHYGEDIKWLQRILNKGYKYISLGGMVPISTNDLVIWLDDLFVHHLSDSNGVPVVKVHGFGLTSLRLMLRYPWYSVDSTSWVVTGRMGSIYVPKFRGGQWLYTEDSWKICVSSQSPNSIIGQTVKKDIDFSSVSSRGKEVGKHISTMSNSEKRILLDYIHTKGYKLGISEFKNEDQSTYKLKDNEKWSQKKVLDKADKIVKNAKRQVEIIVEDGISNRYQLRDEMNIIYFLDLEKSMPEWPWPFKLQSQKGILL